MNIEALKEAHDLSLDGRDFAARQIILDVIADLEKKEPAQQEPVAWMEMVVANLVREGVNKHRARELAEHFIKHTPPPAQRKPLTDTQRREIALGWRGRNWTLGDIIDAVEAAHDIKGDA
jgi:hypothetical protein